MKRAGGIEVNGEKIILTPDNIELVDYIVEQGDNYTKWKSGKLECWGRGPTVTVQASSPWGALFVSGTNSIPSVIFPMEFLEAPDCVCDFIKVSGGNYLLMTSDGALTKNKTKSYELVRGTLSGNIVGYLTYYAVGKWK